MDTLLYNGDFVKNPFGHPVTVSGFDELLQRILIRLSVKKGSFALDRELGSNIHRLRSSNRVTLNSEALIYAREALMTMSDVQALSAAVDVSDDGSAVVTVQVRLNDTVADVAVEL